MLHGDGKGTQTGTGTGTGNDKSLKFEDGFGCRDVPKYPNRDAKRQQPEVFALS